MAGLSLGGVNLDVQGLVAQLMQIESRPLTRLIEKNNEFQSQLSAFGRLKGALSSFQTSMENLSSLNKFEVYKTSTSETDSDRSFTATVDSNATTANYSIDVTQLATTSKYGSDSTNPFADTDTTTISAASTFDVSVNGESMSVAVDGLTLLETRDAINASANSNGVGVTASIVSTQSNEHFLVLTGIDTGSDNEIVITDNDAKTNLKFGTGTTMRIQEAVNATVEVDGQYTISSASNTVQDAISGVTLNLLKTSTAAADLSIERDEESVKTSIESLVSAFNTLNSTVADLKKNALQGDSILNGILNGIKSEFNTSAGLSGSFNFLSEVGVTSDAKTGDLILDSSKLTSAISADYDSVSQLFANDSQGVAFRLDTLMDQYLRTDGLIDNRQDGLNSRIDSNSDDQERVNYRLELIEGRYLKQFSALDLLISESNSTSSYLTQQLASLPGFSSKN